MFKSEEIKNSSNIAAIAYSSDRKELFVQFKNGGVYVYFNVAEGLYGEFVRSKSRGGFLELAMKGNYEYENITKDYSKMAKSIGSDEFGVVIEKSIAALKELEKSGKLKQDGKD